MRKNYWSLIELTIILIVLSILCTILVPVIDRYTRNAKICRVREDVQAIGMAVCMFVEDTANSYFLQDGGGDSGEANRVDVLVSDGDIPKFGSDPITDSWVKSVNLTTHDFLKNHLVTNTVNYRAPHELVNPGDDLMFARSSRMGTSGRVPSPGLPYSSHQVK